MMTSVHGLAQQQPVRPKLKPVAKAKAVDTRPVTQREVQKVIKEAARILGEPGYKPLTPAQTKPVSRDQVVQELSQLFRTLKPKFKTTPRKQPVRSDVLSVSPKLRPDLETLIAWGSVGPFAPLATNKNSTMTPAEFGDALGMFVARMADLTHLPSSKFTPSLMEKG